MRMRNYSAVIIRLRLPTCAATHSKRTFRRFTRIPLSTWARALSAPGRRKRRARGTSARSRSIQTFRKRAKVWRDWNINLQGSSLLPDIAIVIVADGAAAKISNHSRVRRALFDLGLDLSRNSLRDSIDPTVSDGRRAFFSGRADHV